MRETPDTYIPIAQLHLTSSFITSTTVHFKINGKVLNMTETSLKLTCTSKANNSFLKFRRSLKSICCICNSSNIKCLTVFTLCVNFYNVYKIFTNNGHYLQEKWRKIIFTDYHLNKLIQSDNGMKYVLLTQSLENIVWTQYYICTVFSHYILY